MCVPIGLCSKHIHNMIRKHGLETVHFSRIFSKYTGLAPEHKASNSCTCGMKLMSLFHLSSESNGFSLEIFFCLAEHLATTTSSISCLSASDSLSVSEYDSLSECSVSLCSDSHFCKISLTSSIVRFEARNVLRLPHELVPGAASMVYRKPGCH
jgi:uncharacterized protein YuzB (UPF0349 family)